MAQRKRKLGPERGKMVDEEVKKLLSVGFIRKVQYTTWLTNVVMVKSSGGKWRMCPDYTYLNKACPKDLHPLPSIDCLVDGASGFIILNFLDAYSGYNQIPKLKQEKEKMAFMIDTTNYCYSVMPFSLKNAGTIYQRMMDKIFKDQLGKNLEVYVDDMVVKSASISSHGKD